MIPKEKAVDDMIEEIAGKIFNFAISQRPEIGFDSTDLLYAMGLAFAHMAEAYCDGQIDAEEIVCECISAIEMGITGVRL
jgi:hypothetical protein